MSWLSWTFRKLWSATKVHVSKLDIWPYTATDAVPSACRCENEFWSWWAGGTLTLASAISVWLCEYWHAVERTLNVIVAYGAPYKCKSIHHLLLTMKYHVTRLSSHWDLLSPGRDPPFEDSVWTNASYVLQTEQIVLDYSRFFTHAFTVDQHLVHFCKCLKEFSSAPGHSLSCLLLQIPLYSLYCVKQWITRIGSGMLFSLVEIVILCCVQFMVCVKLLLALIW